MKTRTILKIESKKKKKTTLFTSYFKIGIQPNVFSRVLYLTTVLRHFLVFSYCILFHNNFLANFSY